MSSSITNAAFSALRWNYLGFITRSGSNFLIGIFLARLLGPKPFGELAAATFIVGLANLLADAGFTSALIQASTLTSIQIRYVFTIQFFIAILMTLGCASIAGHVAILFHDPAVRSVLLGISPLFTLQAFGQTANALLRRELSFRTLQILQISSYLTGYLLVGVPLAFAGAGVWSLIIAQLVQAAVYAILLYLRVRHPVCPSLDATGGVLLQFGLKTTLSNIINYGISNTDNFVVGHFFGSISLGFYNRGFTLASAPTDGVVGTLQQVLFAACSRADGRLEPIRRAYLACLAAVAFIVMPLFWGMSACATTVMVGLYGEQWRPAAALFQPLALALSVHSLMALGGPVLSSLNLVQKEIRMQSLTLILALTIFCITAKYSVLVLAWGVFFVYVFRFFAITYPAVKVLQVRWGDIPRALLGPAFVGGVTTGMVWMMDIWGRRRGEQSTLALLILLAVGVMTSATMTLLTSRWTFSAELSHFLQEGARNTPPFLFRLLFGKTRRVTTHCE